ncbi:hypothetical protein GCM10007301_06510 [Azorhizobium oxalatiphilum]|uniref:Uncharacterized protein n=1 Tax=Azorhizobium oxalatiphilum TaxID=980631 RepID=A0A917BPY2_9HYPH|nr:Imm50 family immunity protein [Azorhizobium oxalatiphilum]GGF49938.1 hypothetical protein GCM10007301_06510 [Azorhizobium oxalatiphilum]
MSDLVLEDIPGRAEVVAWFGRMPGFHDAELMELTLVPKGESRLSLHAWNLTDRTDPKGYFISERHAVVTLTLSRVSRIELADFHMFPAIVSKLDIARCEAGVRVWWETSYGVEGVLEAERLALDLTPGRP